MFDFFRRSRQERRHREPGLPPELDWDLHCHLLPGVDDGVRSMDEAIDAIVALQGAGYRGGIVTPHVYRGLYNNDAAGLTRSFAALEAEVAARGISYGLRLAAEYFADEHLIDLAGRGELLSFGPPDQPHVLVEFAYMTEPLFWEGALSALVKRGYVPVIAHVERYRFVARDPEAWFRRFARYRVKYQSNVGSLAGQYGPEAAGLAHECLRRGLPTFWGSDLHRPSQVDGFVRYGLGHLRPLGALNVSLSA